MKRLTETTGIALVLSLAALTGAHAGSLNTVPLNAQGKPVSSTVVTTAAGLQANTTINSSIKPYVVPNSIYSQPNTTINSSIKPYVVPNSIYSQPNTTINSSIKPYVVPNSIYSQPNTTINSSINPVSKTVVTTAAGLLAGGSTFAVPNVAASVPKGAPSVPGRSGNYYAQFGNTGAAADGGSGVVDAIYKVGVGVVGYYGAKAVITIAGWGGLGAAGASTAGTTGVATGTTGAVGANAAVDTVIFSPEVIEAGLVVGPFVGLP